jgi:hypothetical protein
MNLRSSRLASSRLVVGVLVVAAVASMPGSSWAVFYPLGPAKDEWGLKYEVEVIAADGDKLNVRFTLADQGRLKPIYSATVVAFSDPISNSGAYLLDARIDLKSTKDGKLTGQVQIPKRLANRAQIRILTQTFDGQWQTAGARLYYIPVKKFLGSAAVAASPKSLPAIASPPSATVTK